MGGRSLEREGEGLRRGREEKKMGRQLPKAVWGTVNRVHSEIRHPGDRRLLGGIRRWKVEGTVTGSLGRGILGENSPVQSGPLKTERPRSGLNKRGE